MDELTAAQNVAEDYRGRDGARGAKALAIDIGKTPTALSHELSETGTAKLGLRTAIKMTLRSKDLRILNAFAEQCGCMVLPLPEALNVEGDDAMKLVSGLAGEFNDVVQSFVRAVADGTVCGNEVAEIRRQWGELQRAGQQLVAHAEKVHEAGKPVELRRTA